MNDHERKQFIKQGLTSGQQSFSSRHFVTVRLSKADVWHMQGLTKVGAVRKVSVDGLAGGVFFPGPTMTGRIWTACQQVSHETMENPNISHIHFTFGVDVSGTVSVDQE